ncbi:MAG: hypothetical protein EOP68_00805 [Sphingomonas sp.]|jgi:UDP-N-acetylmuramoylalanine-D-glutamate ligase|nr:MAG: hypothetical protein EOP68_00805 [Sphingomonas sp.]
MSSIDLGISSTSRAINIAADRAHVLATCRTKKASISAIEDLPAGGTRVVLTNGDDAATVRRAYGKKVITGSVARTPFARM